MANKSYCRFQNTLGDLRDCLDSMMAKLIEGEGDEGDEFTTISGKEANARKQLIETCVEILSFAHENDLLPHNIRIDAADGIGATIDDE